MAGKPFKKGASLYNYIQRIATQANASLPSTHQLSLAERRKLISSVLYPHFQQMRTRDLRVSLIEIEVYKKIRSTGRAKNKKKIEAKRKREEKKAKKKKPVPKGKKKVPSKKIPKTGAGLYNLIIRQLTELNALQPYEKVLSYEQRRHLVKEIIYPYFKSLDKRKVTIKAIRAYILDELSKVKEAPERDVVLIDKAVYAIVQFFDLDNHIRDALPKGVFARANAGEYGRTPIFNTINYSYTGSGLRDLIEELRDIAVSKKAYPVWHGFLKTRPNHSDDGTPENYFIDYILAIDGKHMDDTTEAKFRPDKKVYKQKIKSIREIMQQNFKNKERKKIRRKNIDRRFTKERAELIRMAKRVAKNFKNKQVTIASFKEKKEALKQYVESAYHNNEISDRQYARYLRILMYVKLPK
jgi:hypothetical protein